MSDNDDMDGAAVIALIDRVTKSEADRKFQRDHAERMREHAAVSDMKVMESYVSVDEARADTERARGDRDAAHRVISEVSADLTLSRMETERWKVQHDTLKESWLHDRRTFGAKGEERLKIAIKALKEVRSAGECGYRTLAQEEAWETAILALNELQS